MKKEQILQMAQDAGFLNVAIPPEFAAVFRRFYALVRNAAMEEAAQKVFSWNTAITDTLAKEIRELKEPTP